jgi:hypothetical protein
LSTPPYPGLVFAAVIVAWIGRDLVGKWEGEHIVSGVPAVNLTGLEAVGARNRIALMGDGWLSPPKRRRCTKRCRKHVMRAVGYFSGGDPDFDPRKFRPENFKTQNERISALMDSTILTCHDSQRASAS